MGLPMAFQIVARLFQLICTLLSALVLVITVLRHPFKSLKTKKRTIPPRVLLDPSLGSHEYITANGIKFHYVSAGDKTKPLILFVHGFPEFWYSWRYQLKEFSEDYHVVAVDMRGYGETEKPSGVKNYTMPVLIEDIAKLIQALTSGGECILVAHDWGGGIAWNVAAKYPEIISRLVIINCPHPKVFRKVLQSKKQLLKSWYMFFFQTPWLPELLLSLNDYAMFDSLYKGNGQGGLLNTADISDETIEAYKYTFSQEGALTPPINYYRNLLSSNNVVKIQGNIEVPVLLIWGEDDTALDASLMVEPHKGVCNDITIRCISNCSHFAQQDSPKLVNQYIREFLG